MHRRTQLQTCTGARCKCQVGCQGHKGPMVRPCPTCTTNCHYYSTGLCAGCTWRKDCTCSAAAAGAGTLSIPSSRIDNTSRIDTHQHRPMALIKHKISCMCVITSPAAVNPASHPKQGPLHTTTTTKHHQSPQYPNDLNHNPTSCPSWQEAPL